MSRADFYILPAEDNHARQLFACRLIEKAHHRGHHIWVHTEDEQQLNLIDEQLWHFKKTSFVPHNKYPPADTEVRTTVEVGCQIEIPDFQRNPVLAPHPEDLLINLASQIPANFSRFQRIFEIVIQEPSILDTTRKHYRFYQKQGIELNRHDLRD